MMIFKAFIEKDQKGVFALYSIVHYESTGEVDGQYYMNGTWHTDSAVAEMYMKNDPNLIEISSSQLRYHMDRLKWMDRAK